MHLYDMHRVAINAQLKEEALNKQNRRQERESIMACRAVFESFTLPATMVDYACFLKGYLLTGKLPTHFYSYNFSVIAHRFRIANLDVFIPELYGTDAYNIIVLADTNITFDNLGHNSLYYMKDFTTSDDGVASYTDVALFLSPRTCCIF